MNFRNFFFGPRSLCGPLRHSDVHLYLENGRFDGALKHHYMTRNEMWRAARKREGRNIRG